MKRLVVCCDGTWNTADQKSDGTPVPTNVTKLSRVVAPADDSGVEQRVFYHPGVGTRPGEKFRGGAFGFGLAQDVRDVYAWVVANFEPGDELFFFGFSRGAYTARSAAGFVRNCGILRPEYKDRLPDAYEMYRSDDAPTKPDGAAAKQFRDSYSYETRIRFIGVWDTVGALGIPIGGLRFLNFLNRRDQFHDVTLSRTVDAAFQALAIDEQREPFKPAIWTVQQTELPQHVEQVWFSGVHCNVGGGYKNHGLSDITFLWMIEHAGEWGLAVDKAALEAGPGEEPAPQPLAVPLKDSRTSFYKLLPAYHRLLHQKNRLPAASTAVERYNELPAYRPPGLDKYLGDGPVTDIPLS